MCEKRVAERDKLYDRKCPGLYVSVIPAGVATLYFKFPDRATGKQSTARLGVYNPETFTVEHARTEVYALKTRIGNRPSSCHGIVGSDGIRRCMAHGRSTVIGFGGGGFTGFGSGGLPKRYARRAAQAEYRRELP